MRNGISDYSSVRTQNGKKLYLTQYGVDALRWRMRTLRIATGTGISWLLLIVASLILDSVMKKNAGGVLYDIGVVLIICEAGGLWFSKHCEVREVRRAYEVDLEKAKGRVLTLPFASTSVSRESYIQWCQRYDLRQDPFDENGTRKN